MIYSKALQLNQDLEGFVLPTYRGLLPLYLS